MASVLAGSWREQAKIKQRLRTLIDETDDVNCAQRRAKRPMPYDIRAYTNLAIAATSCLTASTLFSNAARSVAVSSSSMIRSTPLAPSTTGTPT